jgi:hypothetical protein
MRSAHARSGIPTYQHLRYCMAMLLRTVCTEGQSDQTYYLSFHGFKYGVLGSDSVKCPCKTLQAAGRYLLSGICVIAK